MTELDPREKAISIIPHITGGLSLLGSLSIIISVVREARIRTLRTYHHIMMAMSLCDLVSSTAYSLSTWAIPQGKDVAWNDPYFFGARGNELTCTIQGAGIQFGIVMAFFSVALAIHFVLVVRCKVNRRRMRFQYEPFLIGIPIALAVALMIAGIVMNVYANANLWCWIAPKWDTCPDDKQACVREMYHSRWALYYGPLWMCILLIAFAQALLYITVLSMERESTLHFSAPPIPPQGGEARKRDSTAVSRYSRDVERSSCYMDEEEDSRSAYSSSRNFKGILPVVVSSFADHILNNDREGKPGAATNASAIKSPFAAAEANGNAKVNPDDQAHHRNSGRVATATTTTTNDDVPWDLNSYLSMNRRIGNGGVDDAPASLGGSRAGGTAGSGSRAGGTAEGESRGNGTAGAVVVSCASSVQHSCTSATTRRRGNKSYLRSRAIANRASLYALAFVVTWIPYLLPSIIIPVEKWFLTPHNNGFWLLLAIVLFQPIQGFLNALIYHQRAIKLLLASCKHDRASICCNCSDSCSRRRTKLQTNSSQQHCDDDRGAVNASMKSNHETNGSTSDVLSSQQQQQQHRYKTHHSSDYFDTNSKRDEEEEEEEDEDDDDVGEGEDSSFDNIEGGGALNKA